MKHFILQRLGYWSGISVAMCLVYYTELLLLFSSHAPLQATHLAAELERERAKVGTNSLCFTTHWYRYYYSNVSSGCCEATSLQVRDSVWNVGLRSLLVHGGD
jgi:hypothetical protein